MSSWASGSMKVAGDITRSLFLSVMSEKVPPPRFFGWGPAWEWELLGQG